MVPPGELYSEMYISLSWVINSGLLAVLTVLAVLAVLTVALLFIWQWCFTVNRLQWIKISHQPVAMAAVTLCREEKWNNNNDNNSFSLLKTVVQNSQGHLTENQWMKSRTGRTTVSFHQDWSMIYFTELINFTANHRPLVVRYYFLSTFWSQLEELGVFFFQCTTSLLPPSLPPLPPPPPVAAQSLFDLDAADGSQPAGCQVGGLCRHAVRAWWRIHRGDLGG